MKAAGPSSEISTQIRQTAWRTFHKNLNTKICRYGDIETYVNLLTAYGTIKANQSGQNLLDLFLGIQISVYCGMIPKIFLYHEEPMHMQTFTGQTTMGQMVAHGLYSSKNIQDISKDIWNFLRSINVYIFTPQFLVEHLMSSGRTLVSSQWSKINQPGNDMSVHFCRQ